MKKVAAIVVVLICCFMSGCTNEKTEGKNLVIESINWKMNAVQNMQEDGWVIVCEREVSNIYQGAACVRRRMSALIPQSMVQAFR